MKNYEITQKPIFSSYITNLVVVIILCGVLGSLAGEDFGQYDRIVSMCLIVVSILITSFYIWRIYRDKSIGRTIEARQGYFMKYAEQEGLELQLYSAGPPREFMEMSLELLGERDREYKNILTKNNWSFCDYYYSQYRRTKSGEYKANTFCYAVATARLPRVLPNVFFDSMLARKRQFRFQFTSDQRHSLEGDFDKHFTTYFPAEYKIDSLSFITPDVMLAMIDADRYDIEIMGDQLYLYGPFTEPQRQLEDIFDKLSLIEKRLMNNILTYRDERLPYEAGRRIVGLGGMHLRRSKLLKRLGTALIVVYIIIRVVTTFYNNN